MALVWWVFTMIPLPPPIKQIATVVIVVIFALVIIFYFLLPLAGSGGHLGWR
jgi:ABC-type transport system involved in cytochrome c biogenesis permease subunit